MNAVGRLGVYAAALAVVFVVAYFGAQLVVPDSVVDDWTRRSEQQHHSPGSTVAPGATDPAPTTDGGSDGPTSGSSSGSHHEGGN